jgi:hypothetical protein
VRLVPPPAGAAPAGRLLTAVGRRLAGPGFGAYSLLSIPARLQPRAPARPDPRLALLPGAMQLDVRLVPASSGGPIIDRDGRLIGIAMVSGTSPAVALPWSTISALLAQLRPGPRRVFVGWREQFRCAWRLHAFARASHPGFRLSDARINAPVPATRLPGTEDLNG